MVATGELGISDRSNSITRPFRATRIIKVQRCADNHFVDTKGRNTFIIATDSHDKCELSNNVIVKRN